jgi:hypothetical protein
MISEQRIGNDTEGRGECLICGTVNTFACKGLMKSMENVSQGSWSPAKIET